MTMATWPSSWRVNPARITCLCLVAAITSCGDNPAPSSGSESDSRSAIDLADADSAQDWLQVARADLDLARRSAYTSASVRSGSQRGRLVFEDRTHFLIRSIIPVASTSSDGDTADTEFEVVRAVDGKELRILLPAVLGTASSVAVFPVSRFEELAKLRPGHSLHRFRLEALNPVLMAQALVDACSNAEDSSQESGTQHLIADLQAEDLRSLGVIDLNDREESFKLQVHVDTKTGKFLGLKVSGASSEAIRFQLQFTDLSSDSRLHEEGFTLTIPPGYDIVDLAQQLSR